MRRNKLVLFQEFKEWPDSEKEKFLKYRLIIPFSIDDWIEESAWIEENVTGRVIVYDAGRDPVFRDSSIPAIYRFILYFEHEHDMIMFCLAWKGN